MGNVCVTKRYNTLCQGIFFNKIVLKLFIAFSFFSSLYQSRNNKLSKHKRRQRCSPLTHTYIYIYLFTYTSINEALCEITRNNCRHNQSFVVVLFVRLIIGRDLFEKIIFGGWPKFALLYSFFLALSNAYCSTQLFDDVSRSSDCFVWRGRETFFKLFPPPGRRRQRWMS